jgi:hypothetical protein
MIENFGELMAKNFTNLTLQKQDEIKELTLPLLVDTSFKKITENSAAKKYHNSKK